MTKSSHNLGKNPVRLKNYFGTSAILRLAFHNQFPAPTTGATEVEAAIH